MRLVKNIPERILRIHPLNDLQSLPKPARKKFAAFLTISTSKTSTAPAGDDLSTSTHKTP
jgi:hypothetical protein